MDQHNISGIILDGIAGTGKSTTLYKLLESEFWAKKPFISSHVLSEHHTLRVLENKFLDKTLRKEDSIELLDSHVRYLEQLKLRLNNTDWLERDRTAQKLPFILERFHLTHAYHYDHVEWGDVEGIDNRLVGLNAKLLLFTIDPDDIQERIIEDYKKSGWQDYLKTLGSNDEEIKQHFIRKQGQIIELSKKTKLPVKIIESSRMSPTEVLNEVTNFWRHNHE